MNWKPYGYLHEISDNGDVRNISTGRILKPRTSPEGYIHYQFKGKNKKIHRIVAELFVPNPNNYKCVNHIDGDKSNNNYLNLEWCTQGSNLKHAWENGLNKGHSKRVQAFLNGELVGEYKSQYECARQLGLGLSSVCGALKKGQRCKGYTFISTA